MRQHADYVMYPWWPVDGNAWIHPEDVPLARRLIPGRRIFRVCGQRGAFYLLAYGSLRLRVRPAMWLPLRGDGLNVGDQVEVRSRRGRRRPRLGVIREMLWNPYRGRIEYKLERRGMQLASSFTVEDLQVIDPPYRPGADVEISAGNEGEPLELHKAE